MQRSSSARWFCAAEFIRLVNIMMMMNIMMMIAMMMRMIAMMIAMMMRMIAMMMRMMMTAADLTRSVLADSNSRFSLLR